MATRNTVTDEYVVKASISDTASPGLDKLTASMAAADSAAASLADKAAAAGAAIGASGAKFSNAVTQFDQIAKRYDDVNKYTLQLTAAQDELQRAQTSGQIALAKGTTTQEAYAATIAALTQKIAALAEAQGEARAEAEALSESTARWSGIATQGSAAVSDFAAKISAAAQIQQGLTNQINAWNAATVKATESQRLWNATSGVIIDPAARTADRAADIIAYGAALDSVRAKFNPVFAVQATFLANLASASDALNKGAIDEAEAAAAMDAFTAAYTKAGGAIQTVITAEQAAADKATAATAAIAAWTIATTKAANAQQAFNAQLGFLDEQQQADRTAASAADVAAYAAALDAERAALVPVFAASKDYEAQLDRISAALATGAISQTEATAATDAATASFSAANQPLADYNAAQVQLAAVTKASFAALDQYSASMDSLRAKYDPVFAANQKYAATMADIAALQEQGATSARVLATATAAAATTLANDLNPVAASATKNLTNLTAAHNQASFATRQLGVQTVQFTTMVATGSPILLAAIQQGHQLIDVALATGTGFEVVTNGVKAAWAAISGFVAANPAISALVALTAAMAALSYMAESTARAQAQMRAELSATRDDYTLMASAVRSASKQIAADSDATSAQATTIAQAFASMPGVAGASLTSLGIMVTGLARAMGTDLPAATKLASEALKDPAKAAQEMASLDKPLTSMSAALLDTIMHLQQTGDRAGATALTLKAMGDTAATAAIQQTPLTAALKALSTALTGTGEDGKSLAQVLGETINAAAAAAISAFARVVQGIENMRQAVKAGCDSVLTNPETGAMGLMQVVPDKGSTGALTTQRYGFNLTDPYQNIAAGLTDLKNKLEAAGGDVDLALKNYGGFKTKDPAAYIASVKGNDLSTTPPNVLAMVDKVAAQFAGQFSEQVVRLGKQVIMPESHGQQMTRAAGVYGPTLPYGPQVPSQADLTASADQQRLANQGVLDQNGVLANQAAIDGLNQKLAGFLALRVQLQDHTSALFDQGALDRNEAAIAKTTIDLANAKDPTRAATLGLLDQAAAAGVVGQADQQLMAISLKYARQREENPEFPDSEAAEVNAKTAALANLAGQGDLLINQNTKTVLDQTAITAGWKNGTAAGNEATIQVQAYTLALDKYGKTNAAAHTKEFVDSLHAVAQSDGVDAIQQLTTKSSEQADATLRVAGAWDGSATSLAHLNNLETARAAALAQKLTPGTDAYTQAVNGYADSLDRAASSAQVLQQEQNSVTAVSGSVSEAFSTVGNAISQAFVQGQGAAVNWGNVMKSVISQVIQKVAELAVLNPILNSLFSQNNGTLGTAVQVLGRSSSAAGQTVTGANGNVFTLSNGSTLASSVNSLSGDSILNTLGITGPGGLFYPGLSAESAAMASTPLAAGVAGPTLPGAVAGQGGGMFGGVGSSISGVLSTPVGASLGSSATVGTLIGGIGGGFALGSLAGGLVQSGLDKTGPAPTIGAAGGAVAGAIAGSFVPVIGTLVGGIIGGLIGGAGGGLIGPHPQSSYSSSALTVANGQFANGPMISQQDDNASAEEAALTTAISNLNTLLAGANIQVTGQSGQIQIGDNSNRSAADPTKFSDLDTPNLTGQTAFSKFTFASSDPTTNEVLGGRTFDTTSDLQTWITGFQAAQVAVKAYLTDTTATLKALGATTGSMPDSLNALNAAYAVDKTNMDALLVSGDLTAQQTIDLTKAETDLATVRDKSIQAVLDQVNEHYVEMDQGFTSRQLTAQATISGSPADAETAQLYAFDANAATQVASLKADLISIFGDSVTSSTSWAQQMGALETTLGQERLAITTTYNKQIVAADTTTFTTSQSSLVTALNALISSVQDQVTALTNNSAALHAAADSSTKFAASLSIGANSPLSPLLQLQAAQAQFSSDKMVANDNGASVTDRTAAATALQSDATTLLGLGKTYYASSANYAALFGSTVTALNGTGGSLSTAADASDAALKVQTDQLAMLTSQRDTAQLIGTQIVGSVAQLQAAMTASFAALVAVEGEAAGLSPQQAALAAKQNVGTSADFVAGQYTSTLGRPEDAAGAAYWQNQIDSGAMTRAQVAQAFLSSPEAMQHHAAGGWVTNGAWNSDSVSAMLAGGEYVLSAPSAARYATMLPAMNAGTLPIGAGTNDNAAVLGELRALRTQASVGSVMETRSQTATLVAEIQALRAEVKGLRADVARNATKPARLTA